MSTLLENIAKALHLTRSTPPSRPQALQDMSLETFVLACGVLETGRNCTDSAFVALRDKAWDYTETMLSSVVHEVSDRFYLANLDPLLVDFLKVQAETQLGANAREKYFIKDGITLHREGVHGFCSNLEHHDEIC